MSSTFKQRTDRARTEIDRIIFSYDHAPVDHEDTLRPPDGFLFNCAAIVAGVYGAKSVAYSFWRKSEVTKTVNIVRECCDAMDEVERQEADVLAEGEC